jgi:tryptophan 7-halogenase
MTIAAQPRPMPASVLIIGDGQLGVLAAIAIKQALPRSSVTVIPSQGDPSRFADHIGTAMPFTNQLHDRLGIDEMELVQKAGASHRLITRYRGWRDDGQDGISCYGKGAQSLGNGFTGQFSGVRQGQSETDVLLTPAVALAATQRFRMPDGDPHSPLALVEYALRWNVGAYRDLLIEQAMRLGVQYLPHLPVDVQMGEDGTIKAVIMEQGAAPIAADLLIDCSGPARWLISRMPGMQFESWAGQLPCDRFLIAPPADAVAALEDWLTITPQGWVQEIGGRDGVRRIFASSASLDMEAVEQEFMKTGATEAVAVDIMPGMLRQPFCGNVVALGDAAASFEPLSGANLDLAHRQLSLLLELLPGQMIEPRERDEYNRRAGLMGVAMRDWLGSHYAGLAGQDTPFAHHVKAKQPSPQLASLMDQHRRRGRLPIIEEAPMVPQEWGAVLRATGSRSQPSVQMLAQPPEYYQAMAKMAETAVRAAVDAAPPYLEWLQSVLSKR